MSSELMDRILSSSNLPSMPVVAIKVLELAQQPDVAINDIADVIQKDPALTAKLLQTANSPLFGLSKKIGSLQQATVILGLRTVKVMALSFSLVDSLQQTHDSEFDYQTYWRRSLTTAALSKLMAQHCGNLRTDECFVGGLLSDIGMLAAFQCVGDVYTPVVRQFAASPQPIQDIEADVLGLTHAEITGRLLQKWSLPDMLCQAVSAHHGAGLESLDQRTRLLASVMYAASCLSELFCADVPRGQLDEVKAHCLELIPITPEALEQTLDELHGNVNEMATLFNIEIGESVSYEALRSQAVVQLANISLSAEMDRAEATNRADQAQLELKKMSKKAATDGLTQIANRQAFDEKLEKTLTTAEEDGGSVGLIIMDIDHFKHLNDTYGHQAGDEALRRVGQCLKSLCTDTVTAARYGGEEFAIILADTTARTLQLMAEGIRKRIEKIQFDYDEHHIQFTASFGAAHVDLKLETTTPKEVIERADECLYEAKHNGRNCVEITF
ncbi:MAG: GGDEF domain-containing protein [Phycisphaerae bacterium]|nr:GGDEF domain-containing protein [Phycisphaerae bacterium]